MVTALLESNWISQLEAAAVTDCGQHRDLNEDAVLSQFRQTLSGEQVGLFVVCDGMGGHQAGEVASRLAAETVWIELSPLLSWLQSTMGSDPVLTDGALLRHHIQSAIQEANAEIRHYAQIHAREAAGMGTTITLALVYGNRVVVANVGDSRAYAWHSGQVTQITRDHSWAAQMAEIGIITESEVADHPRSNILSRALGSKEQVDIDLFERRLQPGDKLFLCSDGLWHSFADQAELAAWLGSPESSSELCRQFVAEANRRDGSDNISAILVTIT